LLLLTNHAVVPSSHLRVEVLRRPPEFALTAAVGVEDHAVWSALVTGHGERVGDEAGAHVIGERPADNAA
jgi:hypothetical protein